MPKAPPAFQFYPQDFVMGTQHMGHEAIACYLLLLCHQWCHGKVPNDLTKMARICRFPVAEFGSIWAEMECKFYEGDDGELYNARLEVVRERQLMLSEKRREAGRLGGQANAKQLPKQKHSKGRLKVEGRRLKVSPKELDAAFCKWWEVVPRKTKRADAQRKYEQAVGLLYDRNEPDPIGFLYDRMCAFAESDKAKSDYCPYPSTWLHQGQYDDDPATWNRGSPTPQKKPRIDFSQFAKEPGT